MAYSPGFSMTDVAAGAQAVTDIFSQPAKLEQQKSIADIYKSEATSKKIELELLKRKAPIEEAQIAARAKILQDAAKEDTSLSISTDLSTVYNEPKAQQQIQTYQRNYDSSMKRAKQLRAVGDEHSALAEEKQAENWMEQADKLEQQQLAARKNVLDWTTAAFSSVDSPESFNAFIDTSMKHLINEYNQRINKEGLRPDLAEEWAANELKKAGIPDKYDSKTVEATKAGLMGQAGHFSDYLKAKQEAAIEKSRADREERLRKIEADKERARERAEAKKEKASGMKELSSLQKTLSQYVTAKGGVERDLKGYLTSMGAVASGGKLDPASQEQVDSLKKELNEYSSKISETEQLISSMQSELGIKQSKPLSEDPLGLFK